MRRMAMTSSITAKSLAPTRVPSVPDGPLLHSSFVPSKCQRFQFSVLNAKPKQARSSSLLRAVRAQSSADYKLEADFYKVEAILRPWRVPHVSSGLLKIGIRGVTVSDVRGFGAQGTSMERQDGSEFSEDKLVAKVKMEIVVTKDQVETVVGKIIEEARTGEIGDGKIFLIPVSDLIRVRTGERGALALKMTGPLDSISSAV